MDCLQNIIGLSQTDCECLTSELPSGSDESVDYNTSESGIFLDELDGFNINMITGSADCAKGGVWDILNRSRQSAIQDFKNNLLGCVGAAYKPRLKNFNWQLGESTFKGTRTEVTGSYAGMRISPAQIKGGVIVVKEIGVLINETADVTVEIYSNENGGTLIYTSNPISATADVLTVATLSVPQELPMWSRNIDIIRYYVVMVLDGTFKPKSNKKDCGCVNKAPQYLRWLDISGTEGSDPSDITSFKVNSTYANGITINVDVKCKSSEIICSDQYPLDFEEDGYALNMAFAIRIRAGAIAYQTILDSTNINRLTMMNRDELKTKIVEWNAEFQKWVTYLCENVNVDVNDCLICRTNKTSLTKSTILT